jgi:GNAT superfamily N-acetyltransferase
MIRSSIFTDALAISQLLPDLGYKATESEVVSRLSVLSEREENEVIVVEISGNIVGFCHVQGVPLLASSGYAEVQALVVARSHQRTGLGRASLERAVSWSRESGYKRVRLRSGLHRDEAHLFYEVQGFSKSKPSYAFELALE